jgi:hypothetical protein
MAIATSRWRVPDRVVCHERAVRVPAVLTVREMKEGPSGSAIMASSSLAPRVITPRRASRDSFLVHSLSHQLSEEGAIPRDAEGAIFHGARQP